MSDPWDYTAADLARMDALLRELAEMEGWSDVELRVKLDERRRMAPANVKRALLTIQTAHRAALSVWPQCPPHRARIVLLWLPPAKTPDPESDPI